MEDFSESLCSLNNLLCAVVEVGISSLYTIQVLVIASSVVCRKYHSGSMRRITEHRLMELTNTCLDLQTLSR